MQELTKNNMAHIAVDIGNAFACSLTLLGLGFFSLLLAQGAVSIS